jgi:hypothetical protein
MLLVKIILCSKFPWTKFIDCKCFDVISVGGGCRDLENAARKFCSERVRVDMSAGEVRGGGAPPGPPAPPPRGGGGRVPRARGVSVMRRA